MGGATEGVRERSVTVHGIPYRVWEKGEGEPLGYFAGLGGLPRWPAVLDKLAESRRVIAPSLPGFPGGGRAHTGLDSHLDWVLEAEGLVAASGLAGADLVGVSVGGALAADVAAIWPEKVRRLVLISPFGMYDERQPVMDIFALPPGAMPGEVCQKPEVFLEHTKAPENEGAEWHIEQVRASEAAARLLWPLGDTRLSRRLGRIGRPTLVLWGEADRVIPPSYAGQFAEAIGNGTRVEIIEGAGHLADLDAPDDVARRVLDFLS